MGKKSQQTMTGLNSKQRIQAAKDKVAEKERKEHEARVKILKELLATRR